MDGRVQNRLKFIEAMKEHLTLDPKTTALVIVDMHQGHLDPGMATVLIPKDGRERVLTNAKRLIKIIRTYDIPVIHVILQLRPIENQKGFNPFFEYARKVNEKLELEEKSWIGKPRVRSTWWQPAIMPEVGPEPSDYVINSKKTFSAYMGTDLEHLLRLLDVDTVVIIGVNTNTCDLCTSFEAANRGFRVVVISDCVDSAYGDDLHMFALANIARCVGWVLTISEFEEKLTFGPCPRV